MNQEALRAMPEKDLSQVIVWAQEELRAREEKRKQDVIAKIKELAASIDVPVTIKRKRGRPSQKASTTQAKRRVA